MNVLTNLILESKTAYQNIPAKIHAKLMNEMCLFKLFKPSFVSKMAGIAAPSKPVD